MAYKPKKGRVVVDSRGLDLNKSYSSFWMDNGRSNEKFGGWSDNMRAGSDLVKLIKLANYRRAVTNFVKITTKQEIPVMWAGDTSFTNGKAITLSTNIKEDNFDVTVGLALHESAHIVLSDFSLVSAVRGRKHPRTELFLQNQQSCAFDRERIASLFNWIEDRRIDNFIFTTSPGYKAYYHKLYDHYFNLPAISKGLKSASFRNHDDMKCWELHIFNMINPAFNPKAMPGLAQVASAVDLRNIGRLKSSEEALEVALDIAYIIDQVMSTPPDQQKPKPQPKEDEGQPQDPKPAPGASDKDKEEEATSDKKQEESEPTPSASDDEAADNKDQQGDGEQSSDGASEEDSDGDGAIDWESDDTDTVKTDSQENQQITQALAKQSSFLNGDTDKQKADYKMKEKLEKLQKDAIEMQTIGNKEVGTMSCLMYDITNPAKLAEIVAVAIAKDNHRATKPKSHEGYEVQKKWSDIMTNLEATIEASGIGDYFSLGSYSDTNKASEYSEAIQQGLEMGGLLGKKLQLHNESRERVDSRLRNGKIDNKRLSHAGYGIEAVFKQIHIDKHKKANLRISLDGSGSMSGSKWAAATQMTTAIAKAITYTQGISLQVDIRVTATAGNRRSAEIPACLEVYNSRTNKLNHLVDILKRFEPNSVTPEGLCFEAMMKKGKLVDGTSDVDSYFLNLSDGEPCMGKYAGQLAHKHTKDQINKMRTVHNIQIMSFFITNSNTTPYTKCDPNYLTRNKLTTAELYKAFQDNIIQTNFKNSYSGKAFRVMYGKDAAVVDPNSAIGIAKELNKKFMAAKVLV